MNVAPKKNANDDNLFLWMMTKLTEKCYKVVLYFMNNVIISRKLLEKLIKFKQFKIIN